MLGACSDREDAALDAASGAGEDAATLDPSWLRMSQRVFDVEDEVVIRRPAPNPQRNAYFGDLHVHTTYSFDAFAFGTLATPYDAYRYALGAAIQHPSGFLVQLREPLDFYAVTDHAMFLGVARIAADTSTAISRLEFSEPLHDLNDPDNMGVTSLGARIRAFSTFIPGAVAALANGELQQDTMLDVSRAAWRDTIDAAEQFNDPGRFTTFVAYEYTSSTDDRGNLHRNVIFEGAEKLPAVPFSRFHSQNPEDLWAWMDDLREDGIESLAIPHNSNGSNGQMFKLTNWAGDTLDNRYGEIRIRNEPLVEVTQVKGTSETHPLLSKNDEWANFEIMPYRIATMLPSQPAGSYVRDALRRGLEFEEMGVRNPYQFGFVGASDTHTGATSDDESNFFAKVGILDSMPSRRGSTPLPIVQSLLLGLTQPDLRKEVGGRTYVSAATETWGAAGLAGVWAEENTREAIYAAFRRKETFATSGTRIRVRFFAGFDYGSAAIDSRTMIAEGYAGGVPMGGELIGGKGLSPQFLVWAIRDPNGAPLQRLQVIKGYMADGESHEVVYDVACSDGLSVRREDHRCPDNGARVDPTDCSISEDLGAAELRGQWRDPDFDPDQRAFYYVRVLENPTCRWSTWDAVKEGVEPRPDLQKTIQERAWSSPIWYLPASQSQGDEDLPGSASLSPGPPQAIARG